MEKLDEEQTLFRTVATVFFNTLELEETIKIYQEIDASISKRINELDLWEKIGRSRKSEIVSTQVLLYKNESAINRISTTKLITG